MTMTLRTNQNLSYLVLAVTSALLIHFTNVKVDRIEGTRPIPPPENLQHFTFGYNENFADSLWIRLIQDIDHCDTASILLKSSLCENVKFGWSYQMLNVITTITPMFRMPYNHGATVLSVTVQDRDGAKRAAQGQ